MKWKIGKENDFRTGIVGKKISDLVILDDALVIVLADGSMFSVELSIEDYEAKLSIRLRKRV